MLDKKHIQQYLGISMLTYYHTEMYKIRQDTTLNDFLAI